MQSLQFDQSQLAAVTQENEGLRKQVEQMEAEAKKWVCGPTVMIWPMMPLFVVIWYL